MLNTQKHTTLFSLGLQPGIKPVFFIFLFVFQVFCLKAQENLVPNGSFEEYWGCPTSNNLNDGQFEKAKGWLSPTNATPDYFNRCNNGAVGIPNNFWGFQEAFHGDGYVGIVPISWRISTSEYIGSEYVQTELIKPLQPCREYYFEMYANFSNYSRYAFSKIGVTFSKNQIQFNNTNSINLEAQVLYNSGFLNDTVDWVKLSGSFIASGNEKYLSIGYFFDSVQNDTLHFQEPISFDDEGYGYYYIDMVSLIELEINSDCEYLVPNVFTPNNDGNNDVWVYNSGAESDLYILNRWGEVVYHRKGLSFIWDGEDCSDGVYYYKLQYQDEVKTGFIQLIR